MLMFYISFLVSHSYADSIRTTHSADRLLRSSIKI